MAKSLKKIHADFQHRFFQNTRLDGNTEFSRNDSLATTRYSTVWLLVKYKYFQTGPLLSDWDNTVTVRYSHFKPDNYCLTGVTVRYRHAVLIWPHGNKIAVNKCHSLSVVGLRDGKRPDSSIRRIVYTDIILDPFSRSQVATSAL